MDLMFATTLHQAPLRDHLVSFYSDIRSLARQVADFAEPGLRRQEGVVIIAVPEHLSQFRKALRDRGLNLQDYQDDGLLTWMNAHESPR